ncbi:MAG TPA: tetratricopeptide repeat protein [Vicinamibacteria bacterium]
MFAQLAEELRKEGELAEAIRVSRTGLSVHPNYPSARMTLGRALFDSGDLPAARAEFEAVLRGAPDNILASRFLAECLEAMGDLGSALLQYRALQRLAAGDRQIEAQIRGLEEKLTPPRRPAGGPPAAPPRPAAPPGARAPRPPSRGPHAPPAPPPAVVPAAGPPPVAAIRSLPVAPGPPPVNAARAAPPSEESFELEAPFEASPRLSAADPSLLRPLPLDVTLDETIDETSLTLPGGSAPRVDAPPPAPSVAPPSVPRSAPSVAPDPPRATQAPAPPGDPVPPAVGYLETPPRTRIEGLSAPSAPPAPTPETPALSSSTLAELYFRQGFLDKAIEVYQQLLQREPNNERGRARLGELRALPAPSVPPKIPPAAAAAAAPEDERTTRRRVIERAIARLEDLLLTIRRNAPAAGPR